MRTLYDYERQTDEEISFAENANAQVYLKDDPDWYFVCIDGEFGFAPSNYLEATEGATKDSSHDKVATVVAASSDVSGLESDSEISEISEKSVEKPVEKPALYIPPKLPPIIATTPIRAVSRSSIPSSSGRSIAAEEAPISPDNAYSNPEDLYPMRNPTDSGKFKTWQVQEIDRKKRKRKGTLGVGNGQIIFASGSDKTAVQQWPIISLLHYNTERKHVFIDLAAPPEPASFDLKAESSQEAMEIKMAIGEAAGAARASGLREVAAANGTPLEPLPQSSALARTYKEESEEEWSDTETGPIGIILYDFEAQGSDELSVRQDNIVDIIDSTTSAEWWKCKLGSREGVVPSSYIEKKRQRKQKNKGKRENVRHNSAQSALASVLVRKDSSTPPPPEPPRPNTGSTQSSAQSSSRSRDNHRKTDESRSLPNRKSLRTWTDRSGTFKVEAEFLGVQEGKVKLHKANGIKISVPLSKMSIEDIEWIDKRPSERIGSKSRNDHDWFNFFLEAGIDHSICTRYSLTFERDQMDESILQEITPETLRRLGFKEGDILRVMRHLDTKFSRKKDIRSVSFGGTEYMGSDDKKLSQQNNGAHNDIIDILQPKQNDTTRKGTELFSSNSGELKNNTRRGRPQRESTVAVNDNISADSLKKLEIKPSSPSASSPTAATLQQQQQQQQQQKNPQITEPIPLSFQMAPPQTQIPANTGTSANSSNLSQMRMPPPPNSISLASPVHNNNRANEYRSSSLNLPSPQRPPDINEQLSRLAVNGTGYSNQAIPNQFHQTIVSNPLHQPLQPQRTGIVYRPVQNVPYLTQNKTGPANFQNSQFTGMQPTGVPGSQYMGLNLQQTGSTPNLQMNMQTGQVGSNLQNFPQYNSQPQSFMYQPQQIHPFQQSQAQQMPVAPNMTGSYVGPNSQNTLPPTHHSNGNMIGVHPQQTGYMPYPGQASVQVPQQTGINSTYSQVNMNRIEPQNTGAFEFKAISFGRNPKPLVPTRTGRRANIAAATPDNPFGFD